MAWTGYRFDQARLLDPASESRATKGIDMSEPARRGSGAISTIMGTITNILTLPFRLIGQLFGRRRSRS